jgi:hypothetical protein
MAVVSTNRVINEASAVTDGAALNSIVLRELKVKVKQSLQGFEQAPKLAGGSACNTACIHSAVAATKQLITPVYHSLFTYQK